MSQRICVIEDDESIQDVLRIVLKRAGYETTIFSDGRAIFENTYTIPDLFLIDKQLPGPDGFTICSYLRSKRQTNAIPIIMMSAYQGIEQLSILAGANAFIEKPFEVKTLVSMIQSHIPEEIGVKNFSH